MSGLLQAKDHTSTQILVAAARLFAQHGYDATRMREIADASGLSKASLYHHFAAKDKILYELQMLGLEALIAGAEQAMEETAGDDRATIGALARAHVRTLVAEPMSIGLTAVETKGLTDDQRRAIGAQRAHYARLVTGALRRAQRRGVLREDHDAHVLMLVFTTLLNGTLIRHADDDEAAVAALSETAAGVFLDGLRDPSGGAAGPPRAFEWQLPDSLVADESSGTERWDEILDAAILLFWEKGYAPTTTRALSAAVGLANGSLYHHIAEKEQLLFGAYQRGYRKIYANMRESFGVTDTDTVDRVERFLAAHMETMLRDSHRSSMMVNGQRYLAERRLEDVVDLHDRVRAAMRQVVEDAQRVGAARADLPSATVARLLLGACQWSTQWYKAEGPWSARQTAQLLARTWIEGAAR